MVREKDMPENVDKENCLVFWEKLQLVTFGQIMKFWGMNKIGVKEKILEEGKGQILSVFHTKLKRLNLASVKLSRDVIRFPFWKNHCQVCE